MKSKAVQRSLLSKATTGSWKGIAPNILNSQGLRYHIIPSHSDNPFAKHDETDWNILRPKRPKARGCGNGKTIGGIPQAQYNDPEWSRMDKSQGDPKLLDMSYVRAQPSSSRSSSKAVVVVVVVVVIIIIIVIIIVVVVAVAVAVVEVEVEVVSTT